MKGKLVMAGCSLGITDTNNEVLFLEHRQFSSDKKAIYFVFKERVNNFRVKEEELDVLGPIYIGDKDKISGLVSDEFIWDFVSNLYELPSDNGFHNKETVRKMLSEIIVKRFYNKETPLKEKEAILAAINDGGYFDDVNYSSPKGDELLRS